MSFNYQGPQGFGYVPNTNANTNQNAYNQLNGNQNQSLGYGSNQPENRPVQSSNQQVRYNYQYQNNDPYGNNTSSNTNNVQFQNNSNYSNSYNPQNQYNQTNQVKQTNQNYPTQNMPIFANLMQNSGGINQFSNQVQSNNQKQQAFDNGMNIWADLAKIMDWDALLKEKNLSKKQSDTSWVNYQEQSWLQAKPSDNIEKETQRKFAFPNPYIKYKIIPGVDETMALDVTSKNQPEKGYYKGSLIIWSYHGGPNQQFYIHQIKKGENKKVEDAEYILINAATGFVVSAYNLNAGFQKKPDGVSLCPKMKDNKNQRWRLKRIKQGSQVYTLQSIDTGNVLDCEGNSRSNGTSVVQWKSNNQKNQMWKILPA